jgi:murein L,D-transpeptidase YafK
VEVGQQLVCHGSPQSDGRQFHLIQALIDEWR